MTTDSLVMLGDLTETFELALTVTMTDAAAERTKTLLAQKQMPAGALRVFVVGGGCSGWQYGMSLTEGAEEDDMVFEHGGARVVVDPDSIRHLSGSEIDYVEDIMKSGFTVFNPNAVKGCACGSSFQTADGSGAARACH